MNPTRVFRTSFQFLGGGLTWYPGHMAKATRQLREQLRSVDIVVEVRDARVPRSSGNAELDRLLFRNKRRVLLFNKSDLITENDRQTIMRMYEAVEAPILFTTANSGVNMKSLLGTIHSLVEHDPTKSERNWNVLCSGIPNVGKSTVINHLRHFGIGKGSGAKVGALPGVTRHISKFRICDDPKIYIVDSPGIMMPRIDSIETGLKLALVGSIKDTIVGYETLADFLLYSLNRGAHFEYVNNYGLDEPVDDFATFIEVLARRLGAIRKGGRLDTEFTSYQFLKAYRAGKLGSFVLHNEL